jgi:hypothetical protein
MVMHNTKIDDDENIRHLFAGRFAGHENALVRFQAYCLIQQVEGYPRCHWMLPSVSGEYLPCIDPADAMLIDFGINNQLVNRHQHQVSICPVSPWQMRWLSILE